MASPVDCPGASADFDGPSGDNDRRPNRKRRPKKRKPKSPTVKKPHDPQASNKDIIFCMRIETNQIRDLHRNRILNIVSRVVVVNYDCEVVVDRFVRPQPPPQPKGAPEITDFEVLHEIEESATLHEFADVQQKVRKQIKGLILIGHSLEKDLSLLGLSHAPKNMRDAAKFRPFMNNIIKNNEIQFVPIELKDILRRKLNIQETDIVVEAKECMNLYRIFRTDWEAEVTEALRLKDLRIKQQDQEKRDRHRLLWEQHQRSHYGNPVVYHHNIYQQQSVPRTLPGSFYAASEYSIPQHRHHYHASYLGSVASAPAAVRPFGYADQDQSYGQGFAPQRIEFATSALDAHSNEWSPCHGRVSLPSVAGSTIGEGSQQSETSSVWTPTKNDDLIAPRTDELDLLPSDLWRDIEKPEPKEDVPVNAIDNLWLEGNNDLHLKNSW